MENASKALLIAAAVLIVIIIIAVGMKIYSSTSDTQKVATDTGKTISDKTGEATDLVVSEISGKKANNIKYYSGETETQKKKEKVKTGDTIKIGAERFMVFFKGVETNERDAYYNKEVIKAMPYYNLELSSNPIKQAKSDTYEAGGVSVFSTINYWVQGDDKIDITDSRNSIKQYITAYYTTLANLGADEVEVRLARYKELYESTDITNDLRNPGQRGDFWIGSSNSNFPDRVYFVYPEGYWGSYSYGSVNGVRPIIIIPK